MPTFSYPSDFEQARDMERVEKARQTQERARVARMVKQAREQQALNLREMRGEARRYAQKALSVLVEAMLCGDTWGVRVAAAEKVLDRAFGKPTQPIAGDEDMAPVMVNDAREYIARQLARLAAGERPAGDSGEPDAGTMH